MGQARPAALWPPPRLKTYSGRVAISICMPKALAKSADMASTKSEVKRRLSTGSAEVSIITDSSVALGIAEVFSLNKLAIITLP